MSSMHGGRGHHTVRRRRVAGPPRLRRTRAMLGATAVTVGLAACSVVGQDDPDSGDDGAGSGAGTVVLVTHDSFALSDEVVADFEADSGLTLQIRQPGDAGALVNQLVLTRESPLGDVVYGVDNTFATRALDEDVLEPYASQADGAPATQSYAVDDTDRLTAVDYSDVCVNADLAWFAERDLALPRTLDDLTDPAYRDLLVVTDPATSSPGLAFLAATVAAYGDDWDDYWADLRANGVSVVDGWSDAYFVDFSGSEGAGPRPLVLSYASSPPAEARDGEATTTALLDTCYRQVEYAGVLAGAQNPEGAQQVVDWMLSDAVQAELPRQMYVYPVRDDVALPPAWERFAPLAPEPYALEPEQVGAEREEWIDTWAEVVTG